MHFFAVERDISPISPKANPLGETVRKVALYGGGVPFVGEISIHECDEQGACLQLDDIEVTIPPKALPPEETVRIKMGVALYGPFSFDNGYQPVSPILLFCTPQNIKFNLPITFKIPHTVVDPTGLKFSFMKAKHSSKHLEKLDSKLSLNFGESPHGVASSKHCCYLCIGAQSDSASQKIKSKQKGYCLHLLIKKIDASTYRIVITATYFLQTCLRVSLL